MGLDTPLSHYNELCLTENYEHLHIMYDRYFNLIGLGFFEAEKTGGGGFPPPSILQNY